MSWQKAPRTLGEVSPTLLCPNAATKSARMGTRVPFPPPPPPCAASEAAQASRNCEATPLLSPEMRSLVLLMEVQCTGNQVTAPRPLFHKAGMCHVKNLSSVSVCEGRGEQNEACKAGQYLLQNTIWHDKHAPST